MISFEEFASSAVEGSAVPLVETLSADLLTPLSVYLKLSSGGARSFLLESVEGGENLARFSFIGCDPYMLVSGGANGVEIQRISDAETLDTPLWSFLRSHFEDIDVAAAADLPSFVGGAIGYFGFSCAGWFEPTIRMEDTGSPEAEFMFFSSIVAFDHVKQTIKLISLVFVNETDEVSLRRDYETAAASIASSRRILEEGPLNIPFASPPQATAAVFSNWERSDFEAAVAGIKESIAAGECYQVVLSQRFTKATPANAISVYRALRSLNPSPYMFLLQFPDKAIIGASPEMLVRSRGRNLEYRPIAGTRPRGRTPEDDETLARGMAADEKEIAEHQMLVDLGRNDLGRVAKYGSVKVDGLMRVEKYSHVQHLVSYLSAELRDGCDRFDAFAACFPAGTVSGAPKVRAIEMIHRLEPTDPGVYAGAVGYFDYSGNMDMCITIRTLVLADGEALIQAGAGIVADSVPAREFDETENKAKALFRAVEIAESQETK